MLHIRPIARSSAGSSTLLSCSRPSAIWSRYQPLINGSLTRLSSTSAHAASTSSEPPKRRSVSLRPFIYATGFLALGLVGGHLVRLTISPPPLPEPGSEVDIAFQQSLNKELDKLPVVEQLRASQDGNIAEGEDKVGPDWKEVSPLAAATDAGEHWGSVQKIMARLGAEETEEKNYLRDTLAGMRGLGPQRRFYNTRTHETITVFWLGGGLTGWPGVAHGGFIATIFLEAFGSSIPTVDKSKASNSPIDPSSLTLTYLAPTLASNFYVLRTTPSPTPTPGTELPPQKDMTKRPLASKHQPAAADEEWTGTLETIQGKVCVKAKAVLKP